MKPGKTQFDTEGLELMSGGNRPAIRESLEKVCEKLGIRPTPHIYILESDLPRVRFYEGEGSEGESRNRGKFVITRGLLDALGDKEVAAMMTHEIGHRLKDSSVKVELEAKDFTSKDTFLAYVVAAILLAEPLLEGKEEKGENAKKMSRRRMMSLTFRSIVGGLLIYPVAKISSFKRRDALQEIAADKEAAKLLESVDVIISALTKVRDKEQYVKAEREKAARESGAGLKRDPAEELGLPHGEPDKRIDALKEFKKSLEVSTRNAGAGRSR